MRATRLWQDRRNWAGRQPLWHPLAEADQGHASSTGERTIFERCSFCWATAKSGAPPVTSGSTSMTHSPSPSRWTSEVPGQSGTALPSSYRKQWARCRPPRVPPEINASANPRAGSRLLASQINSLAAPCPRPTGFHFDQRIHADLSVAIAGCGQTISAAAPHRPLRRRSATQPVQTEAGAGAVMPR